MNSGANVSIDKRVIKSGGSLYVCVPNEVAEQWKLNKGDEVHIEARDGALRIEPKQSTFVQSISEQQVEAYNRAIKGIEARVTLEPESQAIRLEFGGENKEMVRSLVRNLWLNLPALLSMLGVRTGSEPAGAPELQGGEKK
ncbi:MAG: hypothetical protein HY683_01430 [Chloroflexi bacterium]|nr:hypothetical protein [Chloroflexota bacterium]